MLLGIIPGAGGSQRLPRLGGAALALRMCTDGKPISAPQALNAGILDAIVNGELRAARSTSLASRPPDSDIRKTRDITIAPEAAQAGIAACAEVRTSLADTARGLRAPFAAVAAIEGAMTLPFDQGSVREREIFADCVVSTESRALRHLFFAERDASKIADAPQAPRPAVRSAAVVGAGTMGGGIAMAYASAGIPVLLTSIRRRSTGG